MAPGRMVFHSGSRAWTAHARRRGDGILHLEATQASCAEAATQASQCVLSLHPLLPCALPIARQLVAEAALGPGQEARALSSQVTADPRQEAVHDQVIPCKTWLAPPH